METKQDIFNKDFVFGQVAFVKPASEEDMEQGIDAWLGGIPFAWRRRRIPLKQYGEISIRYSRISGSRTEYDKLLDGSFKPELFIFQFPDAVVICLTSDIVLCLKEKKYSRKENRDGLTSAVFIKLEDIKHLVTWRIVR